MNYNLELLEIINEVFERKGVDIIVPSIIDNSIRHTKLPGYIFLNDDISINYRGENAVLICKMKSTSLSSNITNNKITLDNLSLKEFLEDYVADYIKASRILQKLDKKLNNDYIESFKRNNIINSICNESS